MVKPYLSVPHILGDRPKMAELQSLHGHRGQRIRILEEVGHEWKKLASVLHFENSRIARIDRDAGTVTDSCHQMFDEWLDSSSGLRQPVTWATLVQCLDEAGLTNVTGRLKEIIYDRL